MLTSDRHARLTWTDAPGGQVVHGPILQRLYRNSWRPGEDEKTQRHPVPVTEIIGGGIGQDQQISKDLQTLNFEIL